MGKIGAKKMVKVEDLRPYERNARTHSDEQVAQIAKSIEEFGFLNPILIDEQKNIIAGHGRVMAAQKLGLTEVPCLYVDGLTEEQRRAYILADNRLTELGGWDTEIVSDELKTLKDAGFDFSITGFNIDDIIITDEMDVEMEEDELAELEQTEPRINRGEVWVLGRHRLMCGDSTDENDVRKLMDGATADLLLTDPPYNVALGVGDTPEIAKKRHRRTDGLKIENDAMESNEFEDFLCAAFANATTVMKSGAAYYCWYASTSQKTFQTALERCGLPPHQVLIWVKQSLVLGRQDYQWRHEPCFYGWKDGAAHYFIDMRSLTTVQDDLDTISREKAIERLKEISDATTVVYENKPITSKLHPTMKPVAIFRKLIRNSTRPNEVVLDLFGGSGTSLIAAEELGRTCYMMEFDPHYADVIIARWEQETGKKAVRVNG